ncbi:MAG: hypothetical protein O3A46_05540, partial [Candidatus Poribacteria bacterium]|nr:hypothetical protein [Candidatus Poribacteria bacterium]
APFGLVAAYRLTENDEYTKTRALLVGIGTAASGLLGSGFVYVLSNTDDARIYLPVSTATSALGYWLTDRATEDMPKP